jgi:hypothetical protein
MIAQCVNPNCSTQLHSFLEGRLFQFEVISISVSAADRGSASFDEKPKSQTAQFWLCGDCAETMSLVLEPVNGLRLVPLEVESADIPNHRSLTPSTSPAHKC